MRTIYIADDGTQFDDKFNCEDYEWKLNHPYLRDINFLDRYGNKLDDIFSEDTYCKTEKVIVSNDNELKDFQSFANYTGFCCYRDIIECGEWIFVGEEFVKV